MRRLAPVSSITFSSKSFLEIKKRGEGGRRERELKKRQEQPW